MGMPIAKRLGRISKPWQVMIQSQYIGCYANRKEAVEAAYAAGWERQNQQPKGMPIVKRPRRISKPWQVMIKGKYIGCYATRKEAAEAACAAGWERQNHKVTKPKRSFRHVVHRPNRKCPWQVVIQRTYLGSYRTQSLAAAAAAKHLGDTLLVF